MLQIQYAVFQSKIAVLACGNDLIFENKITTRYGLFFIGNSQKIWNIPSGNSNNVNQYAHVGERNGETNNKKRLLVTVMGYSQR